MVMQHVGFYGAVEEMPANEPKVSINRASSPSQKRETFVLIVRYREVRVLEVCNRY